MAKRKSTGVTPKEPVAASASTEVQPTPYQWKGSRTRKKQAKVGPAVTVEILQSALVQVGVTFDDIPMVVIDSVSKLSWVRLPAAVSFCPQCRRAKLSADLVKGICPSCLERMPKSLQPNVTEKKPAATSA